MLCAVLCCGVHSVQGRVAWLLGFLWVVSTCIYSSLSPHFLPSPSEHVCVPSRLADHHQYCTVHSSITAHMAGVTAPLSCSLLPFSAPLLQVTPTHMHAHACGMGETGSSAYKGNRTAQQLFPPPPKKTLILNLHRVPPLLQPLLCPTLGS